MAIFTGKTVDEAITKGLRRLGISKEKAHVRIIQKENKGVLGFGKKNAEVEIKEIQTEVILKADRAAIRDVPEAIRAQAEPVKSASEATVELSQVVAAVKKAEAEKLGELTDEAKKPVTTGEEKKTEQAEEDKEVKEAKEETTDATPTLVTKQVSSVVKDVDVLENLDEKETTIELAKYLTKIAKEMGAPALVKVTHESSLIIFNLESDKQGMLIGKHGKVLNALQYLSQVFVHRVSKERLSVVVNVGDYREKRKEVLTRLAKRTADTVKRTGQPVFLEPMPAFERKQIHAVLSKDPYIRTHSEGDDPYRYLVVEKSGKQI